MTDGEGFRTLVTVGDVVIAQDGNFLVARSSCCFHAFLTHEDAHHWRCGNIDCPANTKVEFIASPAYWLGHVYSPGNEDLNEWISAWIGPGFEVSFEE